MQPASYERLLGLKFISQYIMPNGFARVSGCLVPMRQHSDYSRPLLQRCLSLCLPPSTQSCLKQWPTTFGNPEWKEAERLGFRLRRSEFKFSSFVTSCMILGKLLAFLNLNLPLCKTQIKIIASLGVLGKMYHINKLNIAHSRDTSLSPLFPK